MLFKIAQEEYEYGNESDYQLEDSEGEPVQLQH